MIYLYDFTKDGVVVHTGVTNSPRDRKWEHIRRCPVRGWGELHVLKRFPTRAAAEAAEDDERSRGAPTEGYRPWSGRVYPGRFGRRRRR